jgi:hypothetical protein
MDYNYHAGYSALTLAWSTVIFWKIQKQIQWLRHNLKVVLSSYESLKYARFEKSHE